MLYVCAKTHTVGVNVCVAANECKLPLTHKNLMKQTELRVIRPQNLIYCLSAAAKKHRTLTLWQKQLM